MALRLALLMMLTVIVLAAGAPAFAADDLVYDVHLTGTVTELSYEAGDFILRDRSKNYVVIADDATVQLNGGGFGSLWSLKDRALVRVFGDKLSSRTIYANVIIVLDDTGRYVDLSLNSADFVVDDTVEINGIVTHVLVHSGSIILYAGGRRWIVVPRYDTYIARFGYRTDIYGVYRGDSTKVTGRIRAPGTIDADIIQIMDYGCFGGPMDRFWNIRMDVVVGVIVDVPRRPSWAFTIRTPSGMRSVRLVTCGSGGYLARQDLRAGATVQIIGLWDSRTLLANRVALVRTDLEKTLDKTTKLEKTLPKDQKTSGATPKPVPSVGK